MDTKHTQVCGGKLRLFAIGWLECVYDTIGAPGLVEADDRDSCAEHTLCCNAAHIVSVHREIGAELLLCDERLFHAIDDKVAPRVESTLAARGTVLCVAARGAHHARERAQQHLAEDAPLNVLACLFNGVHHVHDHVAFVRQAPQPRQVRQQRVLGSVNLGAARVIDAQNAH